MEMCALIQIFIQSRLVVDLAKRTKQQNGNAMTRTTTDHKKKRKRKEKTKITRKCKEKPAQFCASRISRTHTKYYYIQFVKRSTHIRNEQQK